MLVLALAWVAALMPMCAAAGERWGGSITLTTDYRLHGISQSDESPAIQADLHYDAASGWLAGLWASSVKLGPYWSTSAEIDTFLGYRWAVGRDWSAKLTAVHYAYPWNSPAGQYDYDELVAGAAYLDRLVLTVAYSPNAAPLPTRRWAGSGTALSYELTLRQPLRGGLSAAGGVGHYEVSSQVSSSYWYWSAGLGYGLERLHFDLTYFGTSDSAKAFFYKDVSGNAWSGTVTLSF
jgi:uncharacterized protein (TIGR02001 family)